MTKCKLWPNYQMEISKPTNTNDRLWGGGGGVNDQTQIMNTKLPNEKYPNLPTTNDQFWGGGGRGKLPNGTTKVAQNDSEQPILPNSQLFQPFPSEVAQNDLEWPISPDSQLFQSFPTKVAQNDSEWPNLPDSQLFQSFPTEVLRMTWRGQFHLIRNFSNLFPLKWHSK